MWLARAGRMLDMEAAAAAAAVFAGPEVRVSGVGACRVSGGTGALRGLSLCLCHRCVRSIPAWDL